MEWGVEGVNLLRLGSLPLGLAGQGGFGRRFLLAGVSSWARGEELVIAPVPPPRPKLDDLLAQVTERNLHGEVDTGPVAGREDW